MSNVIDSLDVIKNFRSPVCNIIRSILGDIGCSFEESNNKFYIEYDFLYDCELTINDEDGSLVLLTQLCAIDPIKEIQTLETALKYNLEYNRTRGASIFASTEQSVLLLKTRFPALKMGRYEVSNAIAGFLDCAERLGLSLTEQEDKIASPTSHSLAGFDNLVMENRVILKP